MTTRQRAAAVAMLMIAFIGCGDSREKRLLGRWILESQKATEPTFELEFLGDKSVVITDGSRPQRAYRWSFVEGDRLKVETSDGRVQLMKVAMIDDLRLVLTGSEYLAGTYRRGLSH